MAWFTGIFSNRPTEFAAEMVDKICRQFPPASEPQLAKKGAQRRLEGVIEHIMKDLDAFQNEVRLGGIGKARLGNALLWKLTERGFSKQFAEALAEGIVKYLAIKR